MDTFGTKIIVLISEVSLFQGENNVYIYEVGTQSNVLINQGVLISEVSSFQRCPYFRGVLISEVSSFQRCPYFRGVLISEVPFKRSSTVHRNRDIFLYWYCICAVHVEEGLSGV